MSTCKLIRAKIMNKWSYFKRIKSRQKPKIYIRYLSIFLQNSQQNNSKVQRQETFDIKSSLCLYIYWLYFDTLEKLHTCVFLLQKMYLDNFGMFLRGILLSANLLFLMSEILNIYKIRITYSWLVKDFDSMFWWWWWQLRRRLRRRC